MKLSAVPKVSSLAVFIAGNKILCDVSYRDTVWSPLVTHTARLLNLSSPILDQCHVFRRRAVRMNTYRHNSSYFNCIYIASSQSAFSKRPRTAKIGLDLRLSTSIISFTQRLSTFSCMNFFLWVSLCMGTFSLLEFLFFVFPYPNHHFSYSPFPLFLLVATFPLPTSRCKPLARKSLGPGNEGIRKGKGSQPRFHCIP